MVGQFFKHQLFAPLAGPVLALVWTLPINLFGEVFGPLTKGAVGRIAEILICVGTLVVGYFWPSHTEGEREMARWTWVLPLMLFILLFSWEWADFGMSTAAKAFFEAEPPVGQGIATIIFTFRPYRQSDTLWEQLCHSCHHDQGNSASARSMETQTQFCEPDWERLPFR